MFVQEIEIVSAIYLFEIYTTEMIAYLHEPILKTTKYLHKATCLHVG